MKNHWRTIIACLVGLLTISCSEEPVSSSLACAEGQLERLSRNRFGKIAASQRPLADSLPCTMQLQLDKKDLQLLKQLEIYLERQLPGPEDEWAQCGPTDSLLSLYTLMQQFPRCSLDQLSDYLSLSSIEGEDSSACVLYTGYFTPLLNAAKKRDSMFKVPIYSRNTQFTYSDTSGNDSTGYAVVAFLSNHFDRYQLFLQGSSKIKWQDGGTDYLVYEGNNNHSFLNLYKLLSQIDLKDSLPGKMTDQRLYYEKNKWTLDSIWQRDSFIAFYSLSSHKVKTSSGIRPIAMKTVAADKKIYPIGTLLLGEVPILDSRGHLIRHDYQLLYVIDVGGYIRGPDRLDLYFGEGRRALIASQLLSHYGRIWIVRSNVL